MIDVKVATLVAMYVVLFSAVGTPMVSYAFCTRTAPRWARSFRDVTIGAVAVRSILAVGQGRPPEWWGALAWWTLAVMGFLIFWYNISRALGSTKDRCPPPPDWE